MTHLESSSPAPGRCMRVSLQSACPNFSVPGERVSISTTTSRYIIPNRHLHLSNLLGKGSVIHHWQVADNMNLSSIISITITARIQDFCLTFNTGTCLSDNSANPDASRSCPKRALALVLAAPFPELCPTIPAIIPLLSQTPRWLQDSETEDLKVD
jgi:hypothetical protein